MEKAGSGERAERSEKVTRSALGETKQLDKMGALGMYRRQKERQSPAQAKIHFWVFTLHNQRFERAKSRAKTSRHSALYVTLIMTLM